jgi:hypothetical protein
MYLEINRSNEKIWGLITYADIWLFDRGVYK